ncbi:CvpA family protein [bacterium]|nr:CvpA family protein [bacterium]MBU1991305.1 CvpA family protein [bacterium]
MEFNYFDIIAAIIILLLGLKGIINGFFKEVFGLIGIIGGIFIASRVGDSVGQYLSDMIFKFENSAPVSFTGFLVTLASFWLLMIMVGYTFKKLSSLSGLGPVDKLLGFVFGAGKFFLIAAVIAHAAYNIQAVKASVDGAMKDSILFPVLVETGSFIMKLDPVEISSEVNATMQKTIHKAIDNSSLDIVKDAKEQIREQIQKNTPEMAKDILSEEKSQ